MLKLLSSLRRDQSGGATAAMVIFAIGAGMALGLVVDAGRAYSERARLQAWLDGVALAAAAQLDGRADALTRAAWTVENALPTVSGAFSGPQEEDFEVAQTLWLHDLPEGGAAGMSDAALAAWTTADPARARYALVDAAPRSIAFSALRLLTGTGALQGFTLGARSVARPLPKPACGPPVIAVCAPDEGLAALAAPGAQLRLARNRDGVWSPGEYGVITDIGDDAAGTCDGLEGVARQVCLMAINDPSSFCPAQVDAGAGGAMRVSEPLNTRFDRWAGAAGEWVGSAAIASDENTISGELRTCDGAPTGEAAASAGLPDDPCFHQGTCGWISPPVESDQLALYWERNHGGGLPSGLATRHQVYMHEILTGTLNPAGLEDSTNPMCNPAAAPRRGRREIHAAVVDCSLMAGEEVADRPVLAHLRGLLTAPAPAPGGWTATFDGIRHGVPMIAGDVPSQDWGPGNPGNHKDVGNAGEHPNGDEDWGCGDRGMSDVDDPGCDGILWPEEDERIRDSRKRWTYDPYREQGLMRIAVKQSENSNRPAWKNVPMLFDSAAPTGGDQDLAATNAGNVLIVSEDGDETDPDDEALGGWLIFQFDRPTTIVSLRVLDAEEGGVIRLYEERRTDPHGEFRTQADGSLIPMRGGEVHDPAEAAHVAVPRLGDGRQVLLPIGVENVRTLAYFMPDSGAVDDLTFINSATDEGIEDRLMLEVMDLLRIEEAWGSVLAE